MTQLLPETILPIIDNLKSLETQQVCDLITQTECFGILWKDDAGVCPEMECTLRSRCQTVHEAAQEAQKDKYDPIPMRKSTLSERVAEPVSEDKKHERVGYAYQGRPVDEMVRVLVESLGSPTTLPKNWSPRHFQSKYKDLGRLLVSQTASYHVFLVDGVIVCRFWTNAANLALVDLSSHLLSYAQRNGVDTFDVPKNSVTKLHPCTGRIYCKDTIIAEALAKWIKDAYRL